MIDIYTSNEYTADPEKMVADVKMVGFNRTQNEIEYESTLLSIKEMGQLVPIDVNDKTGLYENGRHRVRACIELGIYVKCIKINNKLTEAQRLEIYNLPEMSGRDLTVAQKAIQAHKFAIISKEPLDRVAKRYKTNARAVSAANSLAGLNRNDILDYVSENGYWIHTNGKKSKDLRSILSAIKSESEELEEIKQEEMINFEDMIKTEKGKLEFWRLRSLAQSSDLELSRIIVDLVNYKYVLKINKETGEIKWVSGQKMN